MLCDRTDKRSRCFSAALCPTIALLVLFECVEPDDTAGPSDGIQPCARPASSRDNLESAGMRGSVKSVSTCVYRDTSSVCSPSDRRVFDPSGNLVTWYVRDTVLYKTYTYDVNGNMVQLDIHGSGHVYQYEYGEDNRVLAHRIYDPLGLALEDEYEYDGAGRLRCIVRDGEVFRTFEYSEIGELVVSHTYGSQGVSTWHYRYDAACSEFACELDSLTGDSLRVISRLSDGRDLGETRWTSEGVRTIRYYYGECGELDSSVLHSPWLTNVRRWDYNEQCDPVFYVELKDGDTMNVFTYGYVYDTHGNWIEQTYFCRTAALGLENTREGRTVRELVYYH